MNKFCQRVITICVVLITIISILSFVKINKTYKMLDDKSNLTIKWLAAIRDKLSITEQTISNIDANVFDSSLDINWIKKQF